MSTALELDEIIEISSDALSVSVCAGRGARVTSLLSRRDNRQWLRQTADHSQSPALPYGSTFTDTNHFGWDEMFPTVDPCPFPTEPFLGSSVPDHGELWQLEWDVVEASPSALSQRATSKRFSYTFNRRLRITDATLRCDYECVVFSDVPVPMLWALHPQFDMHVGSRVTLDCDVESVLDTSDAASVHEVSWLGNLEVERDVLEGADRMIYVQHDQDAYGASIIDLSGSFLKMSWDNQFAPYFGIWLDRGRYTQESVVALEPTNGFFDDLARAYENELIRYFEPGVPTSWWVEITVGGDAPWKST
jgi:galactose mutarotase-like enzyme